jgi:phthalate 4,5-cis-dihydrodiol dehydrogenase
MEPVLRFGVIGLGRAATSMLPSLAAHPHVRLVAAADPRSEARERFAAQFQADAYADAEALVRRPDVDAVYIATPHQCHAEHVILAAAHGKHAICEKPMALTLADCARMNAAVEQAGVKLVIGHTHSFDPPILRMREIIRSGELGRLGMINAWNYTDFLYRPRRPEELDERLGGGIIFNQVPHQVDTVRLLGGGLVQSVRAMAGTWDSARPVPGAAAVFLDFADGAAATIAYSGYDHFRADEFHEWVGEGGQPARPDRHGEARRALLSVAPGDEAALKASTGFGGARQRHVGGPGAPPSHPHFGVVIASCERGDLRPSPRGVLVYDDAGRREIPVPLGRAAPDKGKVVDELYDAVRTDRLPLHDGRWGTATLEVCLAIVESSRARRDVPLTHQVPTRD